MKKPLIYLIGSLRNPEIPHVAIKLREIGFDVFDDWWSASEDADSWWQEHETLKGRDYEEALYGPHADCVFEFDKKWLNKADIAVLVMPAGKSGHIEYGWFSKDKPAYVLFDGKPERFDVMYRFGAGVAFSIEALKTLLTKNHLGANVPRIGGEDSKSLRESSILSASAN